MKKMSKLLLAGAFIYAVAATAYRFAKNYQELEPEKKDKDEAEPIQQQNEACENQACENQVSEEEFIQDEVEEAATEEKRENKYFNIDMNKAAEAAKKTYEEIKEGTGKVIDKTVEVSKVIYNAVVENYGEDIQTAKEKAAKKAEDVKNTVVSQAGKTYNEVKKTVSEKYQTYMEENPDISKKIDDASAQVQATYEQVKEKMSAFVDNFSKDIEELKEDEANLVQPNPEEYQDIPEVSTDDILQEEPPIESEPDDLQVNEPDDLQVNEQEVVEEKPEEQPQEDFSLDEIVSDLQKQAEDFIQKI